MAKRHVVCLVFDGIQSLDLTGPFEVFAIADRVLHAGGRSERGYRLNVVAASGADWIETESGLRIGASPIGELPDRFDTLLVPGGDGARHACDDPAALDVVRALASRAERVVTVCTGAFPVAAAGLADGHRVTTHWARADALAHRYPTVEVDPDPIFVRDGDLWSSAGVTAGIDLALAIVEDDHGAEIAQVCARWLVMFLRRPGGQSQFATPVWTERAERGPIRDAQDLIDADPSGDHRVGVLASRVGMSERHFIRRFTESTGASPASYVAGVRVEAARRALEHSTDTVAVIAQRCGFGTAETMRRTFLRRVGVPPDDYRRRFHQRPMPPERSAR